MDAETMELAQTMHISSKSLANRRKFVQRIGFSVIFLSLLISIFFLFIIVIFIVIRGAGVINWEFLTAMPRKSMTAGGILPAILGTFYLSIGAVLFALPLGILAAIYLNEYAGENVLVRIIKMGINNLAGVPSIVFGLFGLAMKSVPDSFREAGYGVGATKWQIIRGIILPAALPGILTGTILGIGRAAGETAPILFTAATFFSRKLPGSVMDEVLALPYHIYALMTEGTHPESQVPIAYGTALVLLILVLGLDLIAIVIRTRTRKKKLW
jgi:phosphate transport system permease protein